MGSLVPFIPRTELFPRTRPSRPATPRQLALVLDDVRLRRISATERQAILRALAHLMLEAAGAATREAGDEHS